MAVHHLSSAEGLRNQFQGNLKAKNYAFASGFRTQIQQVLKASRAIDANTFPQLAGVEVKPGKAPGMRGAELQAKLFDRGLHLKTTGDVAIVAPAFIASRAQIDQLSAILRDALAEY